MTRSPRHRLFFVTGYVKNAGTTPTYYRKIRPTANKTEADNFYSILSNAEKKAVLEQGEKFLNEFKDRLNQLRKGIS